MTEGTEDIRGSGIIVEKKRDGEVTGGGHWQREGQRALEPMPTLGGCETLPSLAEEKSW